MLHRLPSNKMRRQSNVIYSLLRETGIAIPFAV